MLLFVVVVVVVVVAVYATAPAQRYYVSPHSRPQSSSFLGHVVLKRGALEAAVTGCQKISDIRSRMSSSSISLLMLKADFCPSPLFWGKNFTF